MRLRTRAHLCMRMPTRTRERAISDHGARRDTRSTARQRVRMRAHMCMRMPTRVQKRTNSDHGARRDTQSTARQWVFEKKNSKP